MLWRRRTAVAGVLAGLLLVVGATDAWATTYKYWYGYTYQSAWPGCSYLWIRIDDSNKPQLDSHATWTGRGVDGSLCGQTQFAAPPNSVVVRQDLYYYNPFLYGGQWVMCNQGPWVYNIGDQTSAWTGFGWTSPPCGAGYYAADGAAYIAPFGTWLGGWHTTPDSIYFS